MNDIYDDNSINIHGGTFGQDFDDVGWEPDVIDDSDSESADIFGY